MERTTKPDWPLLLLLMACFLGALVRLMPALAVHFPLNDGGMFYGMAQELQTSRYALPVTTAYNGLGLPYAYPPFGIYVASFLADFVDIPWLDVFLWLPPFISILAIPVFYLPARSLLDDRLRASLATLFFALAPGRYDWHVMGGGITRSFGMLFLLLGIYFVIRLFRGGNWKMALPSILFCSLAILSHPEVGLQTAGLCAVLWLFFGRTRRGLVHAFLVVLGVCLLTLPWWGMVVTRHGLTPFLSAVQTGQHFTVSWPALLVDIFSTSEFLPILFVLRLAGLVYAFWKRQFVLILLVFIPALVDPRSAATIAHLFLSMLAAMTFLDVIPMLIGRLRGVAPNSILDSRAGSMVFFFLVFTLFVECGLLNFRLINSTLTVEERAAMTWVQENLAPGQDFLLLTGRQYSMSDPVQEWFPVLAGGHSQTTLQGLEWILGAGFTARLDDLAGLQACSDLACLDAWSIRTGLAYDYIWLSVPSLQENVQMSDLADSVRSSGQFTVLYQKTTPFGTIIIYKKTGE